MTDRLDWTIDGQNWPNRDASRLVRAAGLTWHIQEFGAGPLIMLVHGTASSTHSWRGLAPLLARTHRVLAMDLPGHGFSGSIPGKVLSLPNMAAATGLLVRELGVTPAFAIGHSAGAAITIRMGRDGALPDTTQLISINGALLPFDGFPGWLFSPLAKLLAVNPLVTRLFNWRATDIATIDRVISGTGSKIDAGGLALYARLFRNPGHVGSALEMMANWNLDTMLDSIGTMRQTLTLIAASGDLAVPAEAAFKIRDRVPAINVELVRGLGHLAHEEQPATIAAILLRLMDTARASRIQKEARTQP
jgi:magnesium chelatase accessory protein